MGDRLASLRFRINPALDVELNKIHEYLNHRLEGRDEKRLSKNKFIEDIVTKYVHGVEGRMLMSCWWEDIGKARKMEEREIKKEESKDNGVGWEDNY